MSLDQLKSTSEILSLYERRGDQIPETKEFENLGIENGAVFHEKLQVAGKKLSEDALSFFPMERSETNIPFGVEVIDAQIPLVLLGLLTPEYSDRLELHLMKPPSDNLAKMTDPKYLYEHCSIYVDKNIREGDIVSEMATIYSSEDNWYQHHRRTYPKYSRQVDSMGVRVPIGKEMLEASEEILKIRAKKEGRVQVSTTDIAQVGVMRWAVLNGYKPVTEEDEKLWERVQAGDSAFYIEDYITDGGANPDYVFWKDPEKGASKYEENGKTLSQVRIQFEKKFYPKESKNAWDTASDVSESVGKIISS